MADAEAEVRAARQAESDSRAAHDEARRKADRLQTEVRTLTNLLKSGGGDLWPALIDQHHRDPGLRDSAGCGTGRRHRRLRPTRARRFTGAAFRRSADVAPLPDGAGPLTQFVEAPPALQRRLSHIGVVSKALGQALQPQLKPGQRLVSREGDVWRWDGFTAAADAPSAAAKRLAERNRLASLEVEMAEAIAAADEARAAFEAARAAVEAASRDRARQARGAARRRIRCRFRPPCAHHA